MKYLAWISGVPNILNILLQLLGLTLFKVGFNVLIHIIICYNLLTWECKKELVLKIILDNPRTCNKCVWEVIIFISSSNNRQLVHYNGARGKNCHKNGENYFVTLLLIFILMFRALQARRHWTRLDCSNLSWRSDYWNLSDWGIQMWCWWIVTLWCFR